MKNLKIIAVVILFVNTLFAQTIITTSNPSLTTICVGNTLDVPFTSTGTYTLGSVYTAQLSDASGNFATLVNLSPILASTLSGNLAINNIIPAGTIAGNGYKIRVVANNPATIETPNATAITITPSTILNTTFTYTTPICNDNPSLLPITGSITQPLKVKLVSAEVHTIAIDSNDHLWAWGYNLGGTMRRTLTDKYTPTAIDFTVTVPFTAGGTFTASPVGLSINPITGEINVAASTPGIYRKI